MTEQKATGHESPTLAARAPFIDQKDAVSAVISGILTASENPLCVVGAAGIGKTAVLRQAIEAPEIRERFGARCFWVLAEHAFHGGDILLNLADSLGIAPGEMLGPRVLRELESAPTLVVFDGLDLPLVKNRTDVINYVKHTTRLKSLTLVVALRGTEIPSEISWHASQSVQALPLEAARSLFLQIAGQEYAQAATLPQWLKLLAGHPAAIQLVATRLRTAQNWQAELEAFEKAVAQGPHAFFAALSYVTAQLPEAEQNWLAILARLPNGLSEQERAQLDPTGVPLAETELAVLGLLQPVAERFELPRAYREFAVQQFAEPQAHWQQTLALLLNETETLGQAVKAGDMAAAITLNRRSPNLEAALTAGFAGENADLAFRATMAIADFIVSVGGAKIRFLEQALAHARRIQNPALEADCFFAVGNIYYSRKDLEQTLKNFNQAITLSRGAGYTRGEADATRRMADAIFAAGDGMTARSHYQHALGLYRKLGTKEQELRCLRNLGDVAFSRSEHELALRLYTQTLDLFEKAGDLLGVANCLQSLAATHWSQNNIPEAERYFDQAIQSYESLKKSLGIAVCLKGLADIAAARGDHERALAFYLRAAPLFAEGQDTVGEASTRFRLATVYMGRGRPSDAKDQFEATRQLFRSLGDLLGMANSIKGLGDVAMLLGQHETARSEFLSTLQLYKNADNAVGYANACKSIGDLAANADDWEEAEKYYVEGLTAYRHAQSALGEAGIIKSQGEIAEKQGKPELARTLYDRAMSIYRRINAPSGVANCLRSLGDLALAKGHRGEARERYKEALSIFQNLNDWFSVGYTYRLMARAAQSDTERKKHVELCRQALQKVGRTDLLAEINQEFP